MATGNDDQEGFMQWDDEEEMEKIMQNSLLLAAAEVEALKREIWSCKVGDLLEVISVQRFFGTVEQSIQGTAVWTEMQPNGQIYRVVDLKGRGFDLELVSGDGPPEIRTMNSEILDGFRVLPPP